MSETDAPTGDILPRMTGIMCYVTNKVTKIARPVQAYRTKVFTFFPENFSKFHIPSDGSLTGRFTSLPGPARSLGASTACHLPDDRKKCCKKGKLFHGKTCIFRWNFVTLQC